MDATTKKAFLLLKSLVFHYHGLDDSKRILLKNAGEKMEAENEVAWANAFLAEDYLSAFERSRAFLSKVFLQLDKSERERQLVEVWEETNRKGYLTEMEATAILTLSKDWQVDKGFLEAVKD